MCSIDNTKFDVEFIQRTLENLDASSGIEYEVTLLLNCLVGLVIIPAEAYLKKNYTFFNSPILCVPEVKELMENQYFQPTASRQEGGIYKSKQLTLANLIRSIRNSVAHNHIYCLPEEGKWRMVRICDINENNKRDGKPHLELEVVWSINQLKHFCRFVAERYIEGARSRPDVRLMPLEAWRG